MKSDIHEILPNITNGIVNKVLFLEVYFLLKLGQSPAYFSLIDFVDNYSLELLYISVFFTMMAGWLLLPALTLYTVFAGILSWFGAKIMSIVRVDGIPIFSALSQQEREQSVSINVATDYADKKPDPHLKKRIDDYASISQERLSNEALAATNFALVGLIAWISHSTGAPNFLMKVAGFADSFSSGFAYELCLALLMIQGFVGRAMNFHLLRASGSLPPSFFKGDNERAEVEAWTRKMIEKHEPLAKKWIHKK